jgi:outer membrane protein assembly factor BamB
LSFVPVAVEVETYEGESQPFSITATSSKTFAQNFNIGIIDKTGVITTDVGLTMLSPLSYRASMRTASNLTAGTHLANLEVRICEDNPLDCHKPFPGSPWQVPLKVNVKSKAEAANRLVLTGGPLQADVYPGEPTRLTFNAVLSADLASKYTTITVVIVDQAKLTASSAVSAPFLNSDLSYKVDLTTAADLSQGEHSGNLEVHVCFDGNTCSQQAAGSPWLMPLKVTVHPPSMLSPLQPMAGLSSWNSFNGNASHTGYVPSTFDPARFTRRWLRVTGSNLGDTPTTANDNGKVFLVRNLLNSSPAVLIAVNELDGQIAWKANVGENASPPAVANGRVYVASTDAINTPGPGKLWVFDQQTGNVIKQTAMDGPGGYMAPTVFGSDLYLGSGNKTGMSKYLGAQDAIAWNSGALTNWRTWTPAVDGNFAYAFLDGKLVAVNAATGANSWQLNDPNYVPGPDANAPVTLAGDRAYVLSENRLMAFDVAARSLVWTKFGFGKSNLVLANRKLYAASGSLLMVKSADTGEDLWSVGLSGHVNEAGFEHVLVTDNLVFVSSWTTTLAIDINTHKVVWSSPYGGDLAISSNGVLYTLDDQGNLIATNLR